MKWAFVLGLDSGPWPGHKEFIWGEKPTGPLGAPRLLARAERGSRWSGTALLDLLSHQVLCPAGRKKTAPEKGLFHRIGKLVPGAWSSQ